MHFTQNSSNKQTQSTHRKARLEPAIRDAQKLAQNVFPPWIAAPLTHVVWTSLLVRVDNLLCFLWFFSHFARHSALIAFGNILFLKSLRRLSCFWKVLIGKMIVRIPTFLCVLYHAHSSHQSLRTSTVCLKTTKCYTKMLSLLSLPILFALAQSWRDKVGFNTWQMLLGVWVHLELT